MDTLPVKTFLLVATMLVITAFSSKFNKKFETQIEFWGLFILTLGLVIFIPAFAFPLNVVLTLILAALMGFIIGPGIRSMMLSFVARKRLEAQGYTKVALKEMSAEKRAELVTQIQNEIESGSHEALAVEWNKIVSLALYSTAGITAIAAFVVFGFDFDFSFLGMFLFVALLGLIVVGLLNLFFFKSAFVRLLSAYVGAVVFSLYLLYDFDRLKDAAGDASWETAVHLATSIYLDIINLFLDLLQILSDSN
jgi:FtsH-binding integral membrane protein